MATINGSTNNSQWTYKLEATELSYSVANNTSVVRVSAYLGRASSRSHLGGNWNGSVTVDGSSQSINGTIPYPTYIDGGGWLLLATKDFTVGHNSDGSKIANISSSFSSSDFVPNSANASGNLTLTTIPRASSISCNGGNIESTTNITISRASSNFTHTIKYSFGNLSGTISTKTPATSIYWTIPSSFYAQIPNSNTGTITLTCETYNSNTLIGTKTITCEARVTNSNPVLTTVSYRDVNSSIVAITENNQLIVRNNSSLRVFYTPATAQNSATIVRHEVTFNNITKTINGSSSGTVSVDFGTVNLSNNADVTVKAIDSRGNSTIISKTVTILDWVNPTAKLTYGRVNNYEDETKIKASVTISSINGKNAIQSIICKYKRTSDSIYNNEISLTNYVEATISIDKLYAWDLQIKINDKFGATTYNLTIAKGMPIMFIDINKLAIGVNSFPTQDKQFNIDGILNVSKDIQLNNMSIIIPSICKMQTNNEDQTIPASSTRITDWTNSISYGDYVANTDKYRLEIKNTKLVELTGAIAGLGYAWATIKMFESETNSEVANVNSLYQMGGNGYWTAPIPSTIFELDESKIYYVYLEISSYNNSTFRLNSGFGNKNTFIQAKKIY